MSTPTESEPLSKLYPLIGEAVVACRLVESTFCYFMRLITQKDVQTFEEIAPISIRVAEKQPMKAYLQEIVKKNLIDPDFAQRIESFIENRHRIIHGDYGGTPSGIKSKHVRLQPDEQLLKHVIEESKALAIEMIRMTRDWLQNIKDQSV